MKAHDAHRWLTVLWLVLLPTTQSAAEDVLTDGKTIPISIRIRQQWTDYDPSGGNYTESGEATFTVHGTIAPKVGARRHEPPGHR